MRRFLRSRSSVPAREAGFFMRAEIPTSTKTLQQCRECGAGAPRSAHFCPQCRRILPLARGVDYFQFFGVPRRLTVDHPDLERRFRELSRQFHPDFFYNANAADRRASLERSSFLNDAYRTLRQPIARAEYLLRLEGMAPKNERDAASAVPPSLLEEVFALNEELDEVRAAREQGQPGAGLRARLEAARRPIDEKREQHERELGEIASEWDALAEAFARGEASDDRQRLLEKLRERMLERNYINNLLATIEREAEQSS
jgi:molecular chaperone HscB